VAHKLSLGRRVKVIKKFGKQIKIKEQIKDKITGKINIKEIMLYKPSFKMNV
jgi:hypothetical protein